MAERHWHRLPRDEVDAPTQGQVDGALSTWSSAGVPVHCRKLDYMTFKGPFQLKWFYDSIKGSERLSGFGLSLPVALESKAELINSHAQLCQKVLEDHTGKQLS